MIEAEAIKNYRNKITDSQDVCEKIAERFTDVEHEMVVYITGIIAKSHKRRQYLPGATSTMQQYTTEITYHFQVTSADSAILREWSAWSEYILGKINPQFIKMKDGLPIEYLKVTSAAWSMD